MVKRLTVVFVLCLFVMFVFAGGVFGAAKVDKSRDAGYKKYLGNELRIRGDEEILSTSPMSKYPAYGSKGPVVTCDLVEPEMGPEFLIEHTQMGHTWYEFQKNGSIGRMISVTSDGYKHISWMFTNGAYGSAFPRWVEANSYNVAQVTWTGQVDVYGGTNKNAGYSNQDHLSDGISTVIYHRTAKDPFVPEDQILNTMLSMEDTKGSGSYTRHWDLPDSIINSSSNENGMWPKEAIKYDADAAKDYIHVIMTEGNTSGTDACMMAYQRCYLQSTNVLVCQSYVNGATVTYTLTKDEMYSDPANLVAHYDSACSITPVVVCSPVSKRVAIAWLKPACDGSCDYGSDIAYIESMSSGDDWVDGTNLYNPETNITNYGCAYPEDYRAYNDLSACYDYNDSLHIIWVTAGFPEPTYWQPGMARLWHYAKANVGGAPSMLTSNLAGSNPTAHNAAIGKPSISAKDPIYHPGGTPDSVYLYCIWTQFDTTTPQDDAINTYTNGELYGAGSNNGGLTWGNVWNLTQTRTPDCAAGDCVGEHWSSLAQNMYDGHLHIEYICDKNAGAAIQDDGSDWEDNDVYYYELQEWDVGVRCECSYTRVDPGSFHRPAMKMASGESKILTLNVNNAGNLPMNYTAEAVGDCISGSYSSTLPINENINLYFTVDGSGACDGTFIQGQIDLYTCDEDYVAIPIHAVVADDYYECPRDSGTFNTVETDYMMAYACANGLQWISDKSWGYPVGDTVHEVFFQGGPFVATSIDGEKVVGRYYGDNDFNAGVRDKLHYDYCDYDDDYNSHLLYTDKVYIIPPATPPTYHCYWHWWEWSQCMKVCEVDDWVMVIKYVHVRRHDPPTWWPEGDPPQGAYTGHEDTYVGVMMDVDCPYDTLDGENARNPAGYDATNNIAWMKGYDYTTAHDPYNNYYAGMALADPYGRTALYTPYASWSIRNHTWLYPQTPWGWLDGDLYDWAATAGQGVEYPDTLCDRSLVITAAHLPAATNASAETSFVMIEAATPNGLAELQAMIDTARAMVIREKANHSFPPAHFICGDVQIDGVVNVNDAIFILNYLFRGQAAPVCPRGRGDVNNDGGINVNDAIYILNYLFRGQAAPNCP